MEFGISKDGIKHIIIDNLQLLAEKKQTGSYSNYKNDNIDSVIDKLLKLAKDKDVIHFLFLFYEFNLKYFSFVLGKYHSCNSTYERRRKRTEASIYIL